MKRVSWGMFFVLALMLALAQQRPAQAGMINGSVSLDTSGLSGTFELAFIFTDGSGTGDANNTVALGNFAFGSGGAAGSVDTLLSMGGFAGDFGTGITLVDNAFLTIFASTFTPGTLLSFGFGLTTNVDAGSTPDQLSIALLLPDGTPVNTSDPSGANSLLTVNIDSALPVFATFASDSTPAPVVTFAATAPEPSSLPLLALALLVAVWPQLLRSRGEMPSREDYLKRV